MQDVEESVEPQEQHYVSRYVFDVLASGDHVELRQDGARLQPDRKRLENAVERDGLMEEEGEDCGGEVECPMREGIRLAIVALHDRRVTIL